jgi:hypothetical protein
MQNNFYWSSQYPHLTHEVLLHGVNVGVWCAASARRIAGPVFLMKQLIAKDMYRSFFQKLTEKERLYGWFQQDSATAHTTCISMQALSDVFGDRTGSTGIWPACSPDLNPCDFFFLGCLKNKVYNSNPQTEEL